MPATVRASAFPLFWVLTAALAACGGDVRVDSGRDAARADASSPPLVLQIGTFGPTAHIRELVRLLSSEPLVSVDWEGRPDWRLAESATESADGSSLTVTLRRNLKFHNGEAVTAQAVRELMVPTWAKPDGEIAGTEAPDERTLVLRLRRPYSLRPIDLFRFSIDDETRLELRTGPFRIVSVDPETVLEPFHDNRHGRSEVQRIHIKAYPTHRAAWTAMMRGEVNFLHEVSRDAIAFVEAGGDIQAYPFLRPYYVPLVFNVKHPILKRPEIRIALNEAIDRAEIVRNGLREHGQAVEGPFWPHHWAYPGGRYPAVYNPEAAKVRLDAAGLRVIDHGRGRAPSRAHFTCLLLQGDTRFERIALVVQQQLSEIGIDMELQLLPRETFVQRIRSGGFEAFIFEMSTGRTLNFPYEFWHSKGAYAMSGYAAADAALDRMRLARTDDEVRLAVSEVMRVMRTDPPAAFLVMPREVRAADKRFEIPYETDRDVFGSVWRIRRRLPQMASAR